MEKKDFINYCNGNLNVSSCDIRNALRDMEGGCYPIRLVDDNIADAIRDLADEFEEKNNLPNDWFDKTFVDEDEVFWELDILEADEDD